ncbi:hypothetical protein ACIBBD_20365 [Streptomyces sp. NPDC051315]|uniref:hypothetical protein n=1 Tax=Streptomyces sp. NPDC051315 TaxID=3365650 RepID=UPI00378EF6A5
MSWTRRSLPALAVCVLLLTGSAGCGSGAAREPDRTAAPGTVSPAPVGKVLEDTDDDGRHYREVDQEGAPDVGVEVEPEADGGWDVRLTVRNFRFSPAGTTARAVAGRGTARLFVDGRAVADLRGPSYGIPAGYLPQGTHQVTARLYADDGTVWAVDGKPVESTADITASEPEASPAGAASSDPGAEASPEAEPDAKVSAGSPSALSAPGTFLRTEGRGSPDRGGKAS